MTRTHTGRYADQHTDWIETSYRVRVTCLLVVMVILLALKVIG